MYNYPSQKENPNGLYGKYHITKADGSHINPNFRGFLLRLDPEGEPNHVQASKKALQTYANEIRPHLPQLAKDIEDNLLAL